MTPLQTLGLRGMGRALECQHRNPEIAALAFEDRLILLLQHEVAERQSTRLAQRLRWARLPQTACVEDIDGRTPRGLERGRLAQLTDLAWIDQHLNVLLSGPRPAWGNPIWRVRWRIKPAGKITRCGTSGCLG